MAPLSYPEAFSYSLKLLSGRQYSEAALLLKLRGKGCSREVSQEVAEKLRELNLLNDRAFAEAVAQDLARFNPSGRRRVKSVLKKRKVSPELASEVASKIDSEEEAERATELAKKYEIKWTTLPKMRRLKRIYDLLVRRGFDFELCRQVIEELR